MLKQSLVHISYFCSNLGFGLLGRCLVEHVFPGITYEEYVTKHILQPLQLDNTGFNITERLYTIMKAKHID